MPKKVLVSGCFDLLHSGHITFLEQAAKHGEVYVCLGSDANIELLKGHTPKFNQEERLHILQAIRVVKHARISSGTGLLDFENDLKDINPDIFIVNSDGDLSEKKELCRKNGIKFLCLQRIPKTGLPERSSSGIKKQLSNLPYRICLAGGWMDQPWMNSIAPGSVVVAQIQPTIQFSLRSGMATSTRQHWQRFMPVNAKITDPTKLAKILFGFENPPGTKYVAGSQDSIGLTHPGINRLDYDSGYWPHHIQSCLDESVCEWLEESLAIVPLFERPAGYDPLTVQNLKKEFISQLGVIGKNCYEAILDKDIKSLGLSLTATHNLWRDILPNTTSSEIDNELIKYDNKGYGRTTSGCGGGYIFVATQENLVNSFRVKIIR